MQTLGVEPEDLREFAGRARQAVDGVRAFDAGLALYEHARGF
jgi:hypothetical protein